MNLYFAMMQNHMGKLIARKFNFKLFTISSIYPFLYPSLLVVRTTLDTYSFKIHFGRNEPTLEFNKNFQQSFDVFVNVVF